MFEVKPRDPPQQQVDKTSEIIDVHPSKEVPEAVYKRISRA